MTLCVAQHSHSQSVSIHHSSENKCQWPSSLREIECENDTKLQLDIWDVRLYCGSQSTSDYMRHSFTVYNAIDDVKAISCTTSNQWRDKNSKNISARRLLSSSANNFAISTVNAIVFMTTLLTSKFQSWQRLKCGDTKKQNRTFNTMCWRWQSKRKTPQHNLHANQSSYEFSIVFVFREGPKRC